MGKVQVFDAIPPIVVCFPCEISIVSSLYYSTTNDLSDRFSKKLTIITSQIKILFTNALNPTK